MKPHFATLHVLRLALSTMVLLVCRPPGADASQFLDNFDSGNDNGWTHLEPLAAFGAPGVFSFPNGGYRLQAGASPDPANLGPGRAGSLRLDQNLAGFVEACDLVSWNNSLNQSFGLLGRVTNPGFGTTRGFAFTYSTAGSINISLIDNEHVTTLASTAVSLDPTKTYHFEFDGIGDALSGFVYNQNASNPFAYVHVENSAYGQGAVGFYLLSNVGVGTADATFDNYRALSSIPEPSSAILFVLGSAAFAFISLRRRKLTGSLGGSGP